MSYFYVPDDLLVLEKSVTGSVDERGRRSYDREWFVRVADWTLDCPPLTWADVPVERYDPYVSLAGTDPGVIALTLKAEPTKERPGDYIVTVHYGSRELTFDKGNTSGNPKQTDQSTDPTSRPWVVDFGSTHSTKIMAIDLNNKPVVNSAGQPFNPPLETPVSNLQIKITAYANFGINYFDPVLKQTTFQDAVNAQGLTIPYITNFVYPANTLRCTEFDPSIEYENNNPYYKVSITCEYKFDGWNPLLMDAGTQVLGDNTGTFVNGPQPAKDQVGNPITAPIPLNGAGRALPLGQQPYYIVSNPATGAITYQQNPTVGTQYSFKFYKTANFTMFFA